MRARRSLIRVLAGLLVLLFAGVFGAQASASGVTSTCGYDTAAYSYDGPPLLSLQPVATRDVRGSRSGPVR